MKRISIVLCITGLAAVAFAQGTVNSGNTAGTLFRTNSFALGGTSGNTANGAPSAGGFLYHVLTAPSTVTTVDASLQGLLSAPWSDTGIFMTNGTLASGGRINGPSGTAGQANNWAPGVFQSYIVVGWSASEGATWSQFRANLVGAHFNGTGWDAGPNLSGSGFIGASTIQVGAAGDAVGAAPFSLFGSSGPSGTPISTPTTLWPDLTGPEPSTAALVSFGAGMFVIYRRRRGAQKA